MSAPKEIEELLQQARAEEAREIESEDLPDHSDLAEWEKIIRWCIRR